MFKQFQRRQLLTNLGILTVLLFVIFSSLYLSTYQDVSFRQSMDLDRLLSNVEYQGLQNNIPVSPGSNISFILVIENEVIVEQSTPPGISQDLLIEAFSLVSSSSGKIRLDDSVLAYDSIVVGDTTYIGFIDATRDQEILDSSLLRFSLIFIGSILITLAVTYFITKKSIQPIKENYDKQREFVANASHELKTPLTVINTNIDVLLSTDEFKENKWLQYIKGETTRMNKLTNNLLYLAKTSDYNNTEKVIFNASDTLESMLLGVDALAYENELTLEYNITPNIKIDFDLTQFSQLMMILLDNAIKYSPKGECIKVDLKSENKQVTISVKNTGVWLSEEEMENIFERFYMSDKSRENKRNSYGLGLSIAREIAIRNNAKLKVTSKENEYTMFTLKIK